MPSLKNLKTGLDRLARWYNKKPFDADQMEMWFDILGHVPNEAWWEIINSCIENEKFMPTPGALKDAWSTWIGKRPEKRVSLYEKKPCSFCDGTGILIYLIDQQGISLPYSYAARCGHCQNWRGEYGERIPLKTVNEIESEGNSLYRSGEERPRTRVQDMVRQLNERCSVGA